MDLLLGDFPAFSTIWVSRITLFTHFPSHFGDCQGDIKIKSSSSYLGFIGALQLTDFNSNDGDEAVVNEDPLAGLDNLGDVLVVDPQDVLGALLLEGIVGGQLDLGTFLQGQLKPSVIL